MVDMHLEVNIVPVSDAERAKQFYQRLGWRLDDDVAPAAGVRLIQFTPPGSACSITFGTGITAAAPGSVQGGLVVSFSDPDGNEWLVQEITTRAPGRD